MSQRMTSLVLDETTGWYLTEIKRLTGGWTIRRIIENALFHSYHRLAKARVRALAAQARREGKER